MRFKKEYFFCSQRLLQHIPEIQEIDICLESVKWAPEFSVDVDGQLHKYQTGYNKALDLEFAKFGWEMQPKLYESPKLIGDYRKDDIFIEVQFGNSSTIYRDYYKFHYGLTHRLLSIAVLIVPTRPKDFFPVRESKDSVSNMAEYDLASKYFKLLPIPVPILLIGLLPEN